MFLTSLGTLMDAKFATIIIGENIIFTGVNFQKQLNFWQAQNCQNVRSPHQITRNKSVVYFKQRLIMATHNNSPQPSVYIIAIFGMKFLNATINLLLLTIRSISMISKKNKYSKDYQGYTAEYL